MVKEAGAAPTARALQRQECSLGESVVDDTQLRAAERPRA
jgi:hypothetical protein